MEINSYIQLNAILDLRIYLTRFRSYGTLSRVISYSRHSAMWFNNSKLPLRLPSEDISKPSKTNTAATFHASDDNKSDNIGVELRREDVTEILKHVPQRQPT